MTETVSALEALWIAICLIGLGWAIVGLLRWVDDNRARIREGLNATLKVLLHGKIRLYALGITKLTLYLVLGVQGALLPAREVPITTDWQRELAEVANITAPLFLIISVVLLILMLGLDDRDRVLLQRVRETERDARISAIIARADRAEQRADEAHIRADIAQATAEMAAVEAGGLKPRVGTAEEEIVVHTDELTDHTDRLDAIEQREKDQS